MAGDTALSNAPQEQKATSPPPIAPNARIIGSPQETQAYIAQQAANEAAQRGIVNLPASRFPSPIATVALDANGNPVVTVGANYQIKGSGASASVADMQGNIVLTPADLQSLAAKASPSKAVLATNTGTPVSVGAGTTSVPEAFVASKAYSIVPVTLEQAAALQQSGTTGATFGGNPIMAFANKAQQTAQNYATFTSMLPSVVNGRSMIITSAVGAATPSGFQIVGDYTASRNAGALNLVSSTTLPHSVGLASGFFFNLNQGIEQGVANRVLFPLATMTGGSKTSAFTVTSFGVGLGVGVLEFGVSLVNPESYVQLAKLSGELFTNPLEAGRQFSSSLVSGTGTSYGLGKAFGSVLAISAFSGLLKPSELKIVDADRAPTFIYARGGETGERGMLVEKGGTAETTTGGQGGFGSGESVAFTIFKTNKPNANIVLVQRGFSDFMVRGAKAGTFQGATSFELYLEQGRKFNLFQSAGTKPLAVSLIGKGAGAFEPSLLFGNEKIVLSRSITSSYEPELKAVITQTKGQGYGLFGARLGEDIFVGRFFTETSPYSFIQGRAFELTITNQLPSYSEFRGLPSKATFEPAPPKEPSPLSNIGISEGETATIKTATATGETQLFKGIFSEKGGGSKAVTITIPKSMVGKAATATIFPAEMDITNIRIGSTKTQTPVGILGVGRTGIGNLSFSVTLPKISSTFKIGTVPSFKVITGTGQTPTVKPTTTQTNIPTITPRITPTQPIISVQAQPAPQIIIPATEPPPNKIPTVPTFADVFPPALFNLPTRKFFSRGEQKKKKKGIGLVKRYEPSVVGIFSGRTITKEQAKKTKPTALIRFPIRLFKGKNLFGE